MLRDNGHKTDNGHLICPAGLNFMEAAKIGLPGTATRTVDM